MECFRLYQSVFEFNAGVYYLIRNIGTYIVGYNPIQIVGPILATFSAALILTISITKNVLSNTNFLRRAMICYLIYLFTATTVHPWYLALPVFFATFVGNITPLVWSFLVLLSYSAYIGTIYKEQSSLLIIEYVIVFFTFIASEIKGIPFFKPDNETAA
jgi:hypothetical protein